jgi:hypothetical protein
MSMIAMPPRSLAPALAPPVRTEAPTVVQQVMVEHTPARSDLLVDTSNWTWVELRDYVVAQIVERFGPFPRDSRKEHAIFSRYIATFGAAEAAAVAQYAFGPTCDGWWGKAPISITRFCKGSDPYFTNVILSRLADAKTT